MRTPLLVFSVLALLLGNTFAASPTENAKGLFEKYVALGAAFDPAIVDLYSDEAKIQNTRTFPTGEKKVMTLPAPTYKELIRKVMPMAKARGDTDSFSEVKYTPEGDNVRVHAIRYSNLKKYSAPLSLLVGPGKDGAWLILEELSESKA